MSKGLENSLNNRLAVLLDLQGMFVYQLRVQDNDIIISLSIQSTKLFCGLVVVTPDFIYARKSDFNTLVHFSETKKDIGPCIHYAHIIVVNFTYI